MTEPIKHPEIKPPAEPGTRPGSKPENPGTTPEPPTREPEPGHIPQPQPPVIPELPDRPEITPPQPAPVHGSRL